VTGNSRAKTFEDVVSKQSMDDGGSRHENKKPFHVLDERFPQIGLDNALRLSIGTLSDYRL
jgi:hypothetical protein